MEQRSARRPHEPEDAGSSPAPATKGRRPGRSARHRVNDDSVQEVPDVHHRRQLRPLTRQGGLRPPVAARPAATRRLPCQGFDIAGAADRIVTFANELIASQSARQAEFNP